MTQLMYIVASRVSTFIICIFTHMYMYVHVHVCVHVHVLVRHSAVESSLGSSGGSGGVSSSQTESRDAQLL